MKHKLFSILLMVFYLCSTTNAEETHLLSALKNKLPLQASTILSTQIATLTRKAKQERVTKSILKERIAAFVNQRDSEERTALHYAANIHYVALVEELLKAGNNYLVADVYKKTPLDYALEKLEYLFKLLEKESEYDRPTMKQFQNAFKVLTLLSNAYNQVVEKKDELLRSYQESAGILPKQPSSTCELL